MKTIIGAFALLFLCPAFAQSDSDTIWRGRDKGQHFEIGMAEGLAVSAIYNEPGRFNWKALGISIATEAAHQAYAIRTNPNKIPMEGFADLVAHSVGAAIGVTVWQGASMHFSHHGDQTNIKLTWQIQ